MVGALAREAQVRWLHSSGTGGPFPTRVGAFGSACAAHTHARARAHARTRPRCTLQHIFSWHCTTTSTTTLHIFALLGSANRQCCQDGGAECMRDLLVW